MRAYLPAYEIKTPASLSEALKWMNEEPGVWRPFAGGTDLMVLFEAGKLSHRKYVNIWGLRELQGIEETSASITIGSLVTYSQVQEHATLSREFPLLCRAASETGAIAIQNRGTLGGNIANASPAADSPPAFLAYDAELELISENGSRWIAYEDFHTGYKTTLLQPNELIRAVRLKREYGDCVQHYRKVGTRKAQAISKVCIAAIVKTQSGILRDVRVALGSVAPTPIRCHQTEKLLKGRKLDAALIDRACREIQAEVRPIDDIRSTAAFRRQVASNLLEEFLSKL